MLGEQKREVIIDVVKAEKLIEKVYSGLVPDENTERFVDCNGHFDMFITEK